MSSSNVARREIASFPNPVCVCVRARVCSGLIGLHQATSSFSYISHPRGTPPNLAPPPPLIALPLPLRNNSVFRRWKREKKKKIMRAHFQERVLSFPISRAWVNWGTNTGRDPSKGEKSRIPSIKGIKRVKKRKRKKRR